jgi:hypothetical protein
LSATIAKLRLGPFGGFGSWEEHTEPSGCGLRDCDPRPISPTDLYCSSHDRFLLFSSMTSGGRVFTVMLLASLICGSFELVAYLRSSVPVDFAYVFIGLGVVALPLRSFKRTFTMTAVLWLVISGLSLAFQFTGTHFHVVTATAFLLGVTSASAFWAALDADGFAMDIQNKNDRPFPGGAVSLVACGLIGIAGSCVVGFAVFLTSHVWHGDESTFIQGAFWGAACFTVASVATATSVGFIYGTGRISRSVPAIKKPTRPKLKDWKVSLSSPKSRTVRNEVDRVSEVVTIAIFRTSEMALRMSVTLARATVNFLLVAGYILVRLLIEIANRIFRLIVLTIRSVVAALTTTALVIYQAWVIAYGGVAQATVNIGLPVGALAVTCLLVTGAAQETRRYIAIGSIGVLLDIIIRGVAAFALASVAWIALASEDWRRSRRSAQRSASITAPYILLFVAASGWLLGVPGTLGYGRIHVGWLTLISTGLIALAILLRPMLNRMDDQAGG